MSKKDKFKPTVAGVGYLGEGLFKITVDGKPTPEYRVWNDVLKRCYNPNCHEKHPTYIGCTVAKEWHNFQTFADWYVVQAGYLERWHLDKDLTFLGNKVYGPSTCALVPQEVNSLLIKRGRYRGKSPIGVIWHKASRAFVASVNRGHGKEHVGSFPTALLAFNAYKSAKEAYIKVVAEKYKDVLPSAIYNNLISYTISITD